MRTDEIDDVRKHPRAEAIYLAIRLYEEPNRLAAINNQVPVADDKDILETAEKFAKFIDGALAKPPSHQECCRAAYVALNGKGKMPPGDAEWAHIYVRIEDGQFGISDAVKALRKLLLGIDG